MAYTKKSFPLSTHFGSDSLRQASPTSSSIGTSSITLQNTLPPPISVNIGVKCPATGQENVFLVKSTESVGHLHRHALLRSGLDAEELLNYGLYLPPQGSRKGKFLEDERPIADYPELLGRRKDDDEGSANGDVTPTNGVRISPDSGVGQDPCWLELLFKARADIEDPSPQSRLRKLKTKVTQSHFMDLVRNQDVHNIEKLLAKGFDPNFLSRKDGEAPITAAAVTFHPRDLIIALVNGGAHIDFRARDSHTALHRATISGNYEAIQTLLDLGQNPNCRDWQGLTPLYHAVSTGISARCTHALLYDHAIIGVEDENGFQEIHQACKADRPQHLENLIAYGADLNAKTKRGQTPLHICVWHEANDCLRQLLIRGADTSQVNDDNQTPLEYALLTNRNEQASILQKFDPADIVPIRDPPSYNTSRRPTVNGPRGAVAYTLMRQNSPALDSLSLIVSPADSLFESSSVTFDRHSVTNFGSPKIGRLSETSRISRSTQSLHQPGMMEDLAYAGTTPQIRKANNFDGKTRKISAPNRTYVPSPIPASEKMYSRTVAMRRGRVGFGFTLNGIPRQVLERRGKRPFLNSPSNQFVSSVTPGGPADRAGVKEGDFVLEIDGQDVRQACHEDTVECILNCGDSLIMRITTPNQPTEMRQLYGRQEYHRSVATPKDESSSLSASDNEIFSDNTRSRSSCPQRRYRGTPPIGFQDSPRSQDRQIRDLAKRAQSSRGYDNRIHAPSPAAHSKERVYVFEEVDGKTKAVPIEKSKAYKAGPRIRSSIKFSEKRSKSCGRQRRDSNASAGSCSSPCNSDAESSATRSLRGLKAPQKHSSVTLEYSGEPLEAGDEDIFQSLSTGRPKASHSLDDVSEAVEVLYPSRQPDKETKRRNFKKADDSKNLS
uniref:PDZ domain-containing protein n=1 Tax=Mesocestoides corti TaxID=53468 RepID=A0A5K3F8H8_MESCO